MPAKTEMSAQEWFYHPLFADMEQGFTFELTDVAGIFVSGMALNVDCWVHSSPKIKKEKNQTILHADFLVPKPL